MKKNEYDLTPEELADIGIEPDDYPEAGEACVDYLQNSAWSGDLIDLDHAVDICTIMLDHQRSGERFSETLDRLMAEGNARIRYLLE